MQTLTKLPLEIIINILQYIPYQEWILLEAVSKQWRNHLLPAAYRAKLPALLAHLPANLHDLEKDNRLLSDKALCIGLEGVSHSDLAILNQRMTPEHVKEFLCLSTLRKTNNLSSSEKTNPFIPHTSLLSHAVIAHNYTLLKNLIEQEELRPTLHTLNVAAGRQKSNLSIIKYLIDSQGIQPERSTLLQAVQSGDVKKVKYFYNETAVGNEIESFYKNEYRKPWEEKIYEGNRVLMQNKEKGKFNNFLKDLLSTALQSTSLEAVQFIYRTILHKTTQEDKINHTANQLRYRTTKMFDLLFKIHSEDLSIDKVWLDNWRKKVCWEALQKNHHQLVNHIAQGLGLRNEPLITEDFLITTISPAGRAIHTGTDIFDEVSKNFNTQWINYGITNEILDKLAEPNYLLKAIEHGNTDLLQYVINRSPDMSLPDEALACAIKHQRLNVIQFILKETDQKLTQPLLNNALEKNHINSEIACYLLEQDDTLKLDLSRLRDELPTLLGDTHMDSVAWSLKNNILLTHEATLKLILDNIDLRVRSMLNEKKDIFPIQEDALIPDKNSILFQALIPLFWRGHGIPIQQDIRRILELAYRANLNYVNPTVKRQLIQNYLEPTIEIFTQLAQAELLNEFWWLLEKTPRQAKIECINAFYEHLPENKTTENTFNALKLSLNETKEDNVPSLKIR